MFKKEFWFFLFSLLLVLFVTLSPINVKGASSFFKAPPHFDKVIHFFIFSILAFNALRLNLKFKTEIVFFCILLGFATEIIQRFIPGRSLDFYDALADTLGVICSYYIVNLFFKIESSNIKLVE